jgi:16S rRNA (uracil1498-N3)-methyltransferase
MNPPNRTGPRAVATRLYRDGPLGAGQTIELDEPAAHHALRVLRLRPGDPVELFNGDGRRYRGRLGDTSGRTAAAVIEEVVDAGTESPLWLGLAQAVPSGDRMDWVVEKAVELGVMSIQPLLSSRCVVRLDAARAARRHEHWQRIVIAACMQSGRDRLPEVLPVRDFDEWARDSERGVGGVGSVGGASVPARVDALRLMLSPRAPVPLTAIAASAIAASGVATTTPGDSPSVRAAGAPPRVWLLAGPEGGLDDDEEALAERSGWRPVRLGPRVLRTETAGLAALAVLQAQLGDY